MAATLALVLAATVVTQVPEVAVDPLVELLVPVVPQALLAHQAVLAVHLWHSVTAAQVELAVLVVTAAFAVSREKEKPPVTVA